MDYDEYDEDFDNFDEDLEDDTEDEVSDYDIESAGSMDGEFDGEYDMPSYSQYGASINLDDLTDEQRDIYDNAYHSGHDAAESQKEN
ncbi:MAG: hypothetical protein Q4E47_03835 [Candidatus Saccharibacteria bacterium]|nr:hypothetical protein [Candidatus Saccharibacteria bacterium]